MYVHVFSQIPERLNSESERVSQELPPDISAQPSLEESSHIREATTLVPQSCKEGDPHSKESQKPVQESRQVPSMGLAKSPPLVTTLEGALVPAALMGVQVQHIH